jgi:multiple sugar transport system ATP-binding protein
MDEPLSNLDAKLRVQMRAEIGRLQRDLGVTTIYVTHDQTEAMTLGHRVAVIKLGVLQQIAPPQELYDRPANIFVGGFIGSPAMNFLGGTLRRDADGGYSLELGQHRLGVPAAVASARPGLASYVDQEIVVGIRPEDIEDAAIAGKAEGRTLPASADLVEPLGADVLVHLAVDVPPPTYHADFAELARDLGEDAGASPGTSSALVARFSPRSKVGVGDNVFVTVDTERLHFFAPASGVAVWES